MMPLPKRALSATLVRIGANTILFDAGEGTQVSWRVSDWTFRSTSTILLSHVHADHIGGLPGILFQIAYSGRTDPVTIYGPEWTDQVVTALLTIVGRLPFELRVETLEGGEVFELPEGARLSTLQLSHRIPCLGYSISVPRLPKFNPDRARELGVPLEHWQRLHQGESVGGFEPEDVSDGPRRGVRLSLITDTRYMDELASFVSGSDLLVCESMYVDDDDADRAWERGHMTLRQAARVARDGRVKRLWVTHFSPKVQCPLEHESFARQLFSGAEIGRPGLKATLAFPD